MKKQHLLAAVAGVIAVLAALLLPAAAQEGSSGTRTFEGELSALNDTGASGTVTVTASGNEVTVEIQASGLSPNLPHAQHFHGAFDAANTCPPPSADDDGDGFVSTAEGLPFYGGIQVSLTTSGDTSAESALALDRFPVADENGDLTYSRTFTVPEEVSENLEIFHVVQHGIDIDGSGEYDGEKESSIAEGVPFEATVPADCGSLSLTSANGVDAIRLEGVDRYATNVAISERAFPDGAQTVHIARGDAFPDALSASMLTADGPLLLVPECGELPPVVAAELARLGPSSVVFVGGVQSLCADMVLQVTAAI